MRTPEELANFDLLCRVEEALSARVAMHGFASLSLPARTVYAVWWLDAEVNNGGFDQFFFNTSGDYHLEALHGLKLIGAPRTAEIVRDAIAAFGPDGPSPDRTRRCEQLASFSEEAQAELDMQTDRFYERPHNLEALLAAYARSHAGELETKDTAV